MRYVKATFADGKVAKRSSVNGVYTHAYKDRSVIGFASSFDKAVKAGRGGEVVSVEEITAKEYRTK